MPSPSRHSSYSQVCPFSIRNRRAHCLVLCVGRGVSFGGAGRSKSLLSQHTKGAAGAGTMPVAGASARSFDSLDLNGDGVIDRAEYIAATQPVATEWRGLPRENHVPSNGATTPGTIPAPRGNSSSSMARELSHRLGLPYEGIRQRAVASGAAAAGRKAPVVATGL